MHVFIAQLLLNEIEYRFEDDVRSRPKVLPNPAGHDTYNKLNQELFNHLSA